MPSSVGGVGTGAGAGASGTRSRGHSFTSTARSEGTSGATSRVQATLYKMPTLQSLFQSLPTHLAFDVEVKYPVETAHRLVVAPDSVDHCCSLSAFGVGTPVLCLAHHMRGYMGCGGAPCRHFTEHVKYEINRFCDAILK